MEIITQNNLLWIFIGSISFYNRTKNKNHYFIIIVTHDDNIKTYSDEVIDIAKEIKVTD